MQDIYLIILLLVNEFKQVLIPRYWIDVEWIELILEAILGRLVSEMNYSTNMITVGCVCGCYGLLLFGIN